MHEENTDKMLPVPTVATMLEINAHKVRRFIGTGEIAAIDISIVPGTGRPRWRISPEDLAKFLAGRTSPATANRRPRRSRLRRR